MRAIQCEEEDRLGARWVLWRNGQLNAFLEGADELELLRTHGLSLEPFYREIESLPEGCRLIPFGSLEYPARIGDLKSPPPFLYVRGALLPDEAIACVGTRQSTRWDEELTDQFVGELADWGAHIASGGAIGIDIAAHRAALKRGKPTTVVLPGGVDVAAPARHRSDYERVLDNGGTLVSMQPLGTQAFKSTFAPRNALLAALSSVLLVLRSGVEGGTMITVSVAERLGRAIFALPGDPRDSTAKGCLELLRAQRARPAWSAEHILSTRPPLVSTDLSATLLNLIGESIEIMELQRVSVLGWEELQTALFDLEIRGQITRFGDRVQNNFP